ncbi:transposase [Pseudonocardia sp. DSM 110487]|uniref:RNA-guided endonuclease InsQ/TnpB family protein n=1 Tax=Pseudonocardia sp. DSM 110487 TaxID=2865833 RepID=UPI001C6A0CEA|nr:RNA-guided endonuclease TnpB family protein [Pseudonocardia sp. DSM 110487]QYN33772.1 transposase [Pseudonocardia sp. DSM 110487]
MEETVRYTYRLRPGAQAERALMAEWHRCRWLWNEAVHQRRIGNKPNRATVARMLTAARKTSSWLRAGSQNAQACMLETWALANKHSYQVRGRAKPAIKKKHKTLPSLGYNRNGFAIVDGRLRLPKGTTIPVVWSRELPCEPTSVRVFQDSLGHWYASFVVRREVEPTPPAKGGIGVDWGVSTPATTTDPRFDLPYAGHRRRCAAELAKAQRRMSRRKRRRGHPLSNGYVRARKVKARIEKKAARQNTHTARTWAKRVVDHHQLIAVEDFRAKFLARTRMARKAADIGLGTLKTELIERAVRAGRQVVIVAPAYTSMTCSRCLARTTQRLGLAERTFSCPSCGHTADWDRNAAGTILAVAERGGTCVDDVRHALASSPVVAGVVRSELEIPRH